MRQFEPSSLIAGIVFCSFFGVSSSEADEVHQVSEAEMVTGFRLESKVGDGRFRSSRALDVRSDERIAVRIPIRKRGIVRWSVVFGDLFRNYENAVPPWEPGAYRWKGVEPIEYIGVKLSDTSGRRKISPFQGTGVQESLAELKRWGENHGRDTNRFGFYHADLGTFWIRAEVEAPDGRIQLSRPLRVSIRSGDGFLDWVESFYNVPGVFGSTTKQSRDYLGADCADVLMSAWSRWRKKPLRENINVQKMTGRFSVVASAQVVSGVPSRSLRWGVDVKAGDMLAVKYNGASKFGHVGVLVSDVNGNGLVDGADEVLHAGPDPLHVTLLKWRAFDGDVLFLRP